MEMRKVTEEQAKESLLQAGLDEKSVSSFFDFHKANRCVWREFENLALSAIEKGEERWSAKGVAEVVRWNLKLAKQGEYRINNNYVAYYARLFALKYPQHKDFFEFREVRGLAA